MLKCDLGEKNAHEKSTAIMVSNIMWLKYNNEWAIQK